MKWLFSQEIKIAKGDTPEGVSILHTNDTCIYVASYLKSYTSIQIYDKKLNLLEERILASIPSEYTFINGKFIVLYGINNLGQIVGEYFPQ